MIRLRMIVSYRNFKTAQHLVVPAVGVKE
jgi:hypothetical protein